MLSQVSIEGYLLYVLVTGPHKNYIEAEAEINLN